MVMPKALGFFFYIRHRDHLSSCFRKQWTFLQDTGSFFQQPIPALHVPQIHKQDQLCLQYFFISSSSICILHTEIHRHPTHVKM